MGFNLPLLNRRRRIGGFSPSILLTGSTAFLWYDPSDVANTNWRRNLLTWTEQFDNAAWIKQQTSITPNAGVAPDGSMTADKLVEDTSNNQHRAIQVPTLNAEPITFSVYAKADGRNFVYLANASSNQAAYFNLTNGTIGTIVGAATPAIIFVGNGWYRCSITSTPAAGAQVYGVHLANTSNNFGYAGDGTSGILLWGAQLEVGSTATEYQRITDVSTEVIERFPTATLYQDAAGTTPVTAPAQPVGLVLDKGQGLVLGPELVTNGDFSNGTTGWTPGNAALSVVGGALRMTVNNTGSYLTEITALVPTVAGRSYELSGLVSRVSGGGSVGLIAASAAYATLAQTQQISGSALTPVRAIFTAVGSTTRIAVIRSTLVSSGEIYEADNISVRELPGFHATQSTAANRPTYGVVPSRGRVNLLTFTEDFSNAVWQKLNQGTGVAPVLTSGFADPDGGNTAWRLQLNAGSNGASDYSLIRQASGAWPASGTRSIWLRSNTGSNQTVTLVATNSGSRVTVTPTWQRFSQTLGAGSLQLDVSVGGTGATGATADILIWWPQVETGSTATPYQRVVSQFDVTDPAGFPTYPLHYLFFSGDLDPRWLQTSTITPSADKVQVFAGVRKLSDAAGFCRIVEYGDVVSVNGSFSVNAPATQATATYEVALRGTQTTAFNLSTFTAPISSVLATQFDISQATRAAEITPRVNGTTPTLTGTGAIDAGSGSFSNQQMFIGRRGGTSLAFNGQLYGLIVRFSTANLDAGLLGQTEKWMGGKTPEMAAPIITGVPTIGVA